MTITVSAWVIPALISVGLLLWALVWGAGQDTGRFGEGGIIILFGWMAGFIVSLIVWLIWALLT